MNTSTPHTKYVLLPPSHSESIRFPCVPHAYRLVFSLVLVPFSVLTDIAPPLHPVQIRDIRLQHPVTQQIFRFRASIVVLRDAFHMSIITLAIFAPYS